MKFKIHIKKKGAYHATRHVPILRHHANYFAVTRITLYWKGQSHHHANCWGCLYYIVKQNNFITKCDRLLLQSQNASGITKCDSYYKVRHNRYPFQIFFVEFFFLLEDLAILLLSKDCEGIWFLSVPLLLWKKYQQLK